MIVYVVMGHESDLFGYNPYDYVIGVYTNSINAETVAKLRSKHYSIDEFYLDDEELDSNSETGIDTFEVVYSGSGFKLENKKRSYVLRDDVELEVIGNKFDTPELLGGGA